MNVNEEATAERGRSSAIWLTLLKWPYLSYSVISHDSPQIKGYQSIEEWKKRKLSHPSFQDPKVIYNLEVALPELFLEVHILRAYPLSQGGFQTVIQDLVWTWTMLIICVNKGNWMCWRRLNRNKGDLQINVYIFPCLLRSWRTGLFTHVLTPATSSGLGHYEFCVIPCALGESFFEADCVSSMSSSEESPILCTCCSFTDCHLFLSAFLCLSLQSFSWVIVFNCGQKENDLPLLLTVTTRARTSRCMCWWMLLFKVQYTETYKWKNKTYHPSPGNISD